MPDFASAYDGVQMGTVPPCPGFVVATWAPLV